MISSARHLMSSDDSDARGSSASASDLGEGSQRAHDIVEGRQEAGFWAGSCEQGYRTASIGEQDRAIADANNRQSRLGAAMPLAVDKIGQIPRRHADRVQDPDAS